MPGVVEVIAAASVGQVIDDLELLILCSQSDEYVGQVLYIPFA